MQRRNLFDDDRPLSPSQRRAADRRRARITVAICAVSALVSLVTIGAAVVLFTLPDLPKPAPVKPTAKPATGPTHSVNVHAPDNTIASQPNTARERP